MAWLWPTNTDYVTQEFGPTHSGIDIGARLGSPVVAPVHARVERVWPNEPSGYGNLVILRTDDGYRVFLAHLARFAPGLAPNQVVDPGQALGEVGSTGNSTGPHLHFEVRDPSDHAISPRPFFAVSSPDQQPALPPGITLNPTPGQPVSSPDAALSDATAAVSAAFMQEALRQDAPDEVRVQLLSIQPPQLPGLALQPITVSASAKKTQLKDAAFVIAGLLLVVVGLVPLFSRVAAKGASDAEAIKAVGQAVAGQGRAAPSGQANFPAEIEKAAIKTEARANRPRKGRP